MAGQRTTFTWPAHACICFTSYCVCRWWLYLTAGSGFCGRGINGTVGGFGLWSVTTTIAGAIVASGRVEVEQNRQIVQHPDGGVIDSIHVVEGQTVKAGQLLAEMDPVDLDERLAALDASLARAGSTTSAHKNPENGRGSTVKTLVAVLRALDRADWLATIAPVTSINPLTHTQSVTPRQRAAPARPART